ncbi:hypothetical protein [Rhizobium leguminosarum]|uniref:DNA mismatch repair proteins mutS family domain-containing protein n=1 Tax=Rhizobium leguminosarum TaxID=384 RepID=A0A6P0BEV8_RHILE|nr:hypothetical protein [Rhizobium leguminosarum]MBY5441155.1 hypothetical protein [Rhizobium leguminosarum]NEI38355.1 hypothetical protein [Rhizobium leguminosarum]NEI45036.1 hypothetical protein [Rhizobium leguminosarum]
MISRSRSIGSGDSTTSASPEGTEIARQIVGALLNHRTRMFFVTHMFEFANGFAEDDSRGVAFLRAERREDGSRTYKLIEGKPLRTSFGEDPE